MLSEDVQNQRGSVNNLDLDNIFQAAPLGGGKITINNDCVCAIRSNKLSQFTSFTRPQISCGIRMRTFLDDTVEDLRTGCFSKRCQLTQRVLCFFFSSRGTQPYKHDLFKTDLAVLDFRNFFKVVREALDTAGSCTCLSFKFTCLRVMVLSLS